MRVVLAAAVIALELVEREGAVDDGAHDSALDEGDRVVQILKRGAHRAEDLLLEDDELDRVDGEGVGGVADEDEPSAAAEGGGGGGAGVPRRGGGGCLLGLSLRPRGARSGLGDGTAETRFLLGLPGC